MFSSRQNKQLLSGVISRTLGGTPKILPEDCNGKAFLEAGLSEDSLGKMTVCYSVDKIDIICQCGYSGKMELTTHFTFTRCEWKKTQTQQQSSWSFLPLLHRLPVCSASAPSVLITVCWALLTLFFLFLLDFNL